MPGEIVGEDRNTDAVGTSTVAAAAGENGVPSSSSASKRGTLVNHPTRANRGWGFRRPIGIRKVTLQNGLGAGLTGCTYEAAMAVHCGPRRDI